MPTLPEIMYPARMNPNLAAQGRNYLANMIPPESVMDPRYAAWKKAQDDAEALGIFSDIALTAIPFAGVAAKGAMAAGRTLAPTAGMAAESYMNKIGGLIPLDVYHGTPHRFPPTAKNPLGEFDASKIGTGEGAQAYGHGLYLAENPQTARIYSANRAYVGSRMQGKPSTINFDDPAWLAQKTIDEFGDTSKATSHLKMVQRTAAKQQSPETKVQVQAAIDLLESGNITTKGSLYKVDLPDEQIPKMLDWNKPLSQQHLDVQKTLQDLVKTDSLGRPTGISVDSNMNGQWAYERLAGIRGAKYAAEAMREAGIPGIKYLDQGSRGAKTGTRNFVVFPGNENILKILQRE